MKKGIFKKTLTMMLIILCSAIMYEAQAGSESYRQDRIECCAQDAITAIGNDIANTSLHDHCGCSCSYLAMDDDVAIRIVPPVDNLQSGEINVVKNQRVIQLSAILENLHWRSILYPTYLKHKYRKL